MIQPQMSTDETQILTGPKDFPLQSVTQPLIGVAFEVHNILGFEFLEKVYQRAMQAGWKLRGVQVGLESKLQVQFKIVVIGDYAADLLVADKIIVGLKTMLTANLHMKPGD